MSPGGAQLGTRGFLAALHPTFASVCSSPATLPATLPLPSLRLASNSDESRAIQICQAVSHRVVAKDFGRGWHRTPRVRLCRGCGERAGLALSFFLLEPSSGAEVAAAVPGPRSAEPGLGTTRKRRWSSRAAGLVPWLQRLCQPRSRCACTIELVIRYFFPYSISST